MSIIKTLKRDGQLGMNPNCDKALLPTHYNYVSEPFFRGKGCHNVNELEKLLEQYKEYAHQQALIKQQLLHHIDKNTTLTSE